MIKITVDQRVDLDLQSPSFLDLLIGLPDLSGQERRKKRYFLQLQLKIILINNFP